jgi:hypothetical protein
VASVIAGLFFFTYVTLGYAQSIQPSIDAEQLRAMQKQVQNMQQQLLQIQAQQDAQQINRTHNSAPRRQVVTTDTLTVRKTPSTSGVRLGSVPSGTRGEASHDPVLQNGFEWYFVEYVTGISGWSAGQWLAPYRGLGGADDAGEPIHTNSLGIVAGQLGSLMAQQLLTDEGMVQFNLVVPHKNTAPVQVNWGDGTIEPVRFTDAIKIVPFTGVRNLDRVEKLRHIYRNSGRYTITVTAGEQSISFPVRVTVPTSTTTTLPEMFKAVNVDGRKVTVEARLPIVDRTATGVMLGSISWGDSFSDQLILNEIPAASATSAVVTVSHTYALLDTYEITIIGRSNSITVRPPQSTYRLLMENDNDSDDPGRPLITIEKIDGLTARVQVRVPDPTFVNYFGTIDWGDGRTSTIISVDDVAARSNSRSGGVIRKTLEHTYSRPGRYLLSVTSTFGTQTTKIITISQ